ncbi:hypothetical protein RD792_014349 [Penstemon davidsonii]|uniref:CCT domain-containing protein n=1 Tax=Penstemon davidsonii TaxID=160366 RepID=A0ABR0CP34_9LAMI|nr:hypothetical protein RD792_014349 [Penstemon davidsonii]
MSSCLSGGTGRAYRLDLEIIKSPSNSWISNSSSPSSTLSESSNSPLTISTRKPRTPRKRPNQTYNEAAAILSTAHPKIFPCNKFTKSYDSCNKNPIFSEPTSDLLMPFQVLDTSGFLLHPPIADGSNPKGSNLMNLLEKPCLSPGEITSYGNCSEVCDDFQEDFDAESILDEEIEKGIDSILGNSKIENESKDDFLSNNMSNSMEMNNFSYGYPVGFEGFDFGNGMRKELRGIRNVDEGDWWRFPCVNMIDINPKIDVKKKKKKKVEIKNLKENSVSINRDMKENLASKSSGEECIPKVNAGLLLKLNYDDVLSAWSDKDSPFSGDAPAAEVVGNDVQGRLAQIDLFSENGVREASVLRYKEKRRTRLFSKKIRYQVRKVNADRRPRMKGRFVRTPNSPDNDEQGS